MVVAPPNSTGASLLLAKASTPDQVTHIVNQTGGGVSIFLQTSNFREEYRHLPIFDIRFAKEPLSEPYGPVAMFYDRYGNRWDLLQPNN